MRSITVSEALTEVKLIYRRISSAKEMAKQYATCPAKEIDPLAAEGKTSRDFVLAQINSIQDLVSNLTKIRSVIAAANAQTNMTIMGQTKSVQDWLKWKSESGPQLLAALREIQSAVYESRQGGRLSALRTGAAPADVRVNLDEHKLLDMISVNDEILTSIDGQLNLVNAQTFVTID